LCYLHAAKADITETDCRNYGLWLDRAKKVEGDDGGRGDNPLACASILLDLAREAGCTEPEIRAYFEKALDFRFNEPETAKINTADFGLSSCPQYVLFNNGSCYTHESRISAEQDSLLSSMSWGQCGFRISRAKVYKIQPRRYGWLEPFIKAAYAKSVNPLPILREITGWEWEMEQSTPGRSFIHYRGPIGDAPGIGTCGDGLTTGGFTIDTKLNKIATRMEYCK
jgi:hypothetical protein